jgi:hypothetical protein
MESRVCAALQRASVKLTSRKQLLNMTIRRIRLVSSSVANQPDRIVSNSCEEILIPASLVDRCSSIVNKPLLIVENLNDGHVYVKLVYSIARANLIPEISSLAGVHLKCDLLNGGGNTIALTFQHECSKGERIGFAIADGDRKFPGGSVGDTAKRLQKVSNLSPLLEARVLNVRTIENLLPRAEMRTLANEIDPVQADYVDCMLRSINLENHWKLIPIKKGIRCYELANQSAVANFWRSYFPSPLCRPSEECESTNTCDKFHLHPISSKLLEKAAQKENDFLMTEQCAEGLIDEWRQISLLFFSFFCGAPRAIGK